MPVGDDMPQTTTGYDTEAGLQTPASPPSVSSGLNVPTFRRDLPVDPTISPKFPGSALAPMTITAAEAQRSFGIRPTSRTFAERNVVPGVELDVETGVDAWDRYQIAARQAETDQLRYLRNKYGAEKVRKGDTGEWIVRLADAETGKEKDVLVSPHKLTLGDFAALSADVPEIATSVISVLGARGLPIIGKAGGLVGFGRDVVAGAAGAQAAGAVKDVIARAGDAPIEPSEIARRRAMAGTFDVALGLPLMGTQRFIEFMRAPGGTPRTQIQFKGREAQKYFQTEYGENVPLTVGQMTGNPDIIRREKFTGKVLGGTKVYQQFEQEQQGAMEKLQRILMGTELPDDDVLGKQITTALQRKTAPLTEAEKVAAGELEKKALTEMERIVASRTAPANNLDATQIGEVIRTGLVKRLDSAKVAVNNAYQNFKNLIQPSTVPKGASDIEGLISAQTLPEKINNATYVGDVIRNKLVALRDSAKANVDALYEQFRNLGGSSAAFKADDLSAAAKKIMDELPPQFKKTDTGVERVGPSGAFASESSVIRRLKELADAEGASYRFSDLQQMRSEVFDDMAKSEAVAGLSKRQLSQIAGAITEAMEKGVNQLNDPALKKALQAANAAYKTELVPFEKKGISEAFSNEFEKAYLFPGQVTGGFVTGNAASDRYNLLKQFFGAGSTEMNVLNRHIADSLITEGQTLGHALDPKIFLSKLSKFTADNPQLAAEVLGGKQSELVEAAKAMMMSAETTAKDKLIAKEVTDIIESGTVDPTAYQRLTKAQQEIHNPLLKQSLKNVTDTYKSNLLPFDKKGIGDLFRNPSESNYVGPAELASRVRSGPMATDKFNALRDMLGSGSSEFRLLKRNIADDLFIEAMDDVSGRVDAKKLMRILGDFGRSNNTREISKEVFGDKVPALMEQARFALKAQEGDKFPADKLRDLLASRSPTVSKLQTLLDAERELDKAFNSKMIRAIAKGDMTGLEIAPEDVVARFMAKPERNAGELTKLMGMLSDRPALVEDIRTRYLESLFLRGNETGKTVAQVLTQARQDKKAMSILGPKMFQDLEQYTALESAIAFPKSVAEGAGSLAGGHRLDQLVRHPIKTIGTAGREWVTAKLLTSELTRKWMMRLPPSPSTFLLVASSAPFVESVARNFGPAEAQHLMHSIQSGVGDFVGKMQAQSETEKAKQNEPIKGAPIPLELKDGKLQWPKFKEAPAP